MRQQNQNQYKTMKVRTRILIGALSALPILATGSARAEFATLTVEADKPGAKVSPTLWGVFFEDINLSADGGIYPELVRNRSFEDSEKPEFWTLTSLGDPKSEMAVDNSTPLNSLNRRNLRVRVNGATTLVNEGYWGMNLVKGEAYQVRLAARVADGFQGPIGVHLQTRAGQDLAKGQVTGLTGQWKWFTLELTPTDPDPKARLSLELPGKGTLWLDMVSVLPKKTWKDHGLRRDLCDMLEGLKPSFVRFPGGCWVEGDDMARMYHWKNTIGDIAHRQPLWNIWAYWATHGLGFHEYLQMCEDLKSEPLFCINVGMSHRENIPMDEMGQWVQDALDAVEYANGPVSSVWGSQRAQNGHPAPFHLKYMEIGNENGGPAYQERYALFHDALKAKYPNVILVANEPTRQRPADIVDEHYYSSPEFFISQAHRYDTYKRDGAKIFVGEYAVTQGCGQGNLRGAIGEAAFMTGMERNADVVVMASYAPLFVNVNHKRWNPDLINFDSAAAFGLPSYYVQQMFSQNRGDTVLPVTLEAPLVTPIPKGGAIGVGTWLTQAEFKDIKVIRNGETLFSSDFAEGPKGWRLHGGEWKAQEGVLRQSSRGDNIRAIIGDPKWDDYTYSLKARKLSGDEGFLILFRVQDDDSKSWWNIGGWGNARHAIEMDGVSSDSVPGRIETGKWYDIRVELKGGSIKCYLDGKLVHDVKYAPTKSLCTSATRASSSGEVILKVVNVTSEEQSATVKLNGVSKITSPAHAIVLTSEKPTDENTLATPTKVAPVTKIIEVNGTSFQHTFPGNSVTVLRLRN